MDTTIRIRAVTVKKLPETFGVKRRWAFFREIENCMSFDRPRIVLDCANVRQLDKTVIHMLLRCLEEAMKRNGDVKLAAISPEAKAILEFTGVNRLFEVFDTPAEAVNSYYKVPVSMIAQTFVTERSRQESENAA